MFRKMLIACSVAAIACSANATDEGAEIEPYSPELSEEDERDLNCMSTFGFGLAHAGKDKEGSDEALLVAMATGYFMGKVQGRNPDFDYNRFMANSPRQPSRVDDLEAGVISCMAEVAWLFPEGSGVSKGYKKMLEEQNNSSED